MEIRNSMYEAVDGIALLQPFLNFIIARGLGPETVDYLFPESLDERDSSSSCYGYRYIISALGQGIR